MQWWLTKSVCLRGVKKNQNKDYVQTSVFIFPTAAVILNAPREQEVVTPAAGCSGRRRHRPNKGKGVSTLDLNLLISRNHRHHLLLVVGKWVFFSDCSFILQLYLLYYIRRLTIVSQLAALLLMLLLSANIQFYLRPPVLSYQCRPW